MLEPIDITEVRRIAHLARLQLGDDELVMFAGQLARILDYFQQLSVVDTRDVEPLAHPMPVTDVTRTDEPHPPLTPDAALSNAPQRQGHFFKVPAVLDDSGGAA